MSDSIGRKLAYTVEEAAELLSISRAQIYRLLDLCELESVTVGRSRRITANQLGAFIQKLEARGSVRETFVPRGDPHLPRDAKRA